MKITDHLQIKDLQKAFTRQFPYLQIHFFLKAHEELEHSPEQERLDPELLIGAIRQGSEAGVIEWVPSMTTAELEQLMKSQYGLHIQVYRKEREQWLQTWATDIWTLEDQNRRSHIMGYC